MADRTDGYDLYYADKLWSLIPAIYRVMDPTTPDGTAGPLQELTARVGAQMAVVRRSIDRMWQDQSIETCDDWVIPYIAALLGAKAAGAVERRLVAKSVHDRRRKGTLPALQETAFAVTGWNAKVGELHRRLGRTRHGLDPALGWPLARTDATGTSLRVATGLVGRRTGTAIGGCADLRNVYGASRAQTPFDELFHTADVRAGRGRTGWQNIPHLGIFVFRLKSIPVDGVTPVEDSRHPGEFTFDPTGREIPLFMGAGVALDTQTDADETGYPVPIDGPLLFGNMARVYASVDPVTQAASGNALRVYEVGTDGATLVTADNVVVAPQSEGSKYVIDPVLGRVRAPLDAEVTSLLVGYHYASASTVGAGGYGRRLPGQTPLVTSTVVAVSGGDDALFSNPAFASGCTIVIGDSRTYREFPDATISGGDNALVVRAADGCRPVLRAKHGLEWTWRITGTAGDDGEGSELVLDGILVTGATIDLEGDFDRVTLTTTTLDPGEAGGVRAVDGQALATTLRIRGRVRRLVIERSIVGVIRADGARVLVENVEMSDTIAQSVRPREPALSFEAGRLSIARSTVLGEVTAHSFEATDSLFLGHVQVVDHRQGCVRFCALPEGSLAPRPYECVWLDETSQGAPLLASTSFGSPSYAQLRLDADVRIETGSEEGSEVGAFCREQTALKERGLLARCAEQMPIGLAPVVVYVT